MEHHNHHGNVEHHQNHEDASLDSTEKIVDDTEMSGHVMSHDDGMMKMYFHGGYNEVILFSFWRISTVGGLIGSMIGCLLLGILYEGLKFLREILLRNDYNRATAYSGVNPSNENIQDDGIESITSSQNAIRMPEDRTRSNIKIFKTNIFSKVHILQTFLQLLQVILSYCLMLIFMTYNIWLCGAVAIGSAIGYFAFGWKKTVVLDAGGDHCH